MLVLSEMPAATYADESESTLDQWDKKPFFFVINAPANN